MESMLLVQELVLLARREPSARVISVCLLPLPTRARHTVKLVAFFKDSEHYSQVPCQQLQPSSSEEPGQQDHQT